ncbi:hypothetical protein SDC9_122308 [bioreactor metagenome]|uniref:HTH marR-type domain-containing protein n=1 Tax=bioreactor metagenome TaxID=1076179 RepID=A0A645CEB9_9ZZZZ
MNELEKKAFIFGTIFTLSNKLQVLGDEFDHSITIKQWLFLVGVSKFRDPPTISEVANYIGYSRQNAKRIAMALQKMDYVNIIKDKTDARALRIATTTKCRAYFETRYQQEIEFLEKIFAGFDPQLTHNVFRGLIRLEQNIREMMKQDEDKSATEETV